MMEKGNITPKIINAQTPLLGTHQQIHDDSNNNHIINYNHNHNHNHNHDSSNDNKEQKLEEEQSQQEITSVVVASADNGVIGEEDDKQLDKNLKKLEFYLKILGFDQTTRLRFVISWVVFFVVGVAIPLLIIELTHCFDCEDFQVKDYEYEILTSHLLLSGVSLICVSFNIHKKGFRKFLFVDRQRGYTFRFKDQYIKKINNFYRLLLRSLIPCCILKATHEIIRMIFVQNRWWLALLNASALIISWTYLSVISLTACMLFHLACNLQVIHFNDYAKVLENESSITNLMDEHMRLREYLSKISHRFRIYLILVFLLVTASLCMTLVQITAGVNGKVTILNGGNFAVTSIIQVVETLLCLHAGTKISSRAHAIGAVASRWHALKTCKTLEGGTRSISLSSLSSNFSDNDLRLLDESSIVSHSRLASVSSYDKRQSFVMYLQTNPGALTVYGWTVDRNLLSTIFAIELSLVLFVLGQTIVFSSPE